MNTRRVRRGAAVCGALLLMGLATACSSSSDSTSASVDPLVGTWHVTSFLVAGTTDLIAGGMGITATFADDGGYSLSITNDQLSAICSSGTSCAQSGTYVASGGSITLTRDPTDVTTFNYTISGSAMTWTGNIDGMPVVITMSKA